MNKAGVLLVCLLTGFVSFAAETPKNSTATGGEQQMPSHCLSKPVQSASRTHSVIHVEAGHPWRLPFGLDRVGQPTRIVVEPDAAPKQGEEVVFVGFRRGREALRERVEFTDRSPLVKEMDPSIDRAVPLVGEGKAWRDVDFLPIVV